MVNVSIVVHKTSPEQLNKALECVMRSDVSKIFIIDNSPSDDLRKWIASNPRVIYKHVANNGFGAGHNIALKESFDDGADFHLVLNADVWWEGDIISPIIEYMESNPDVGLISPMTFYPDGTLQYTCRMLPTPIDLFLKRFMPEALSKKRMKKYLLAGHDHSKQLNCPYLLGSFMLFRVKALKETGLFDERFFMYPEDIDITRRLHENWKTLYWPDVSIVHEHQQASRKSMKMLWIHTWNMVKYFNKWGWIFDKKRVEFNRRLQSEIIKFKIPT